MSADRENRSDLRELRNEIREMKESMGFINKAFEEMKKKFEAERVEKEALRKENVELRTMCKEHSRTIVQLEKRVVQCEQYSRRSNVEIRGVTQKENEDVAQLVSKIGEVIGEPISAGDMDACHRVPTREAGKSNIVVQFRSREKRDSVLEKARKFRVKNNQIGISGESQIYLNEHLCPTLKQLLALAIVKKHECGWRFVWTRNGKIFARKLENSDRIRIETDADLSKIA